MKNELRGDAPAVAQVTQIEFSDPITGAVYTLSINGKSIQVTATSGSKPALAQALADAWNASTIPEFSEITAGVSGLNGLNGDKLELTADTAGVPFAVTVSVSGTGANEQQTVTIGNTPTGGTFTLTFDGQTTAGIAHDATAGDVEQALEALSNVGVGNVDVTGGPLPGTSVTVNFVGSLAGTDVALLTADASALTGGDAKVKVTTVLQGAPQQNEIQEIELLGGASGGDFRLIFDGKVTGPIAFDASAATIETALEDLTNIQSGDLTVTGGPLPATVSVEFGGSLSETDVPEMTIDLSGLTGESIAGSVSTTTEGGGDNNNQVQFIHFKHTEQDGLSDNEDFSLQGDINVTAGTFDLTTAFGTITNIPYDILPNDFLTLLEQQANVGEGAVSVGLEFDNRLDEGGTWDITWIGSQGDQDLAPNPSIDSTNLTGGSYSASGPDGGVAIDTTRLHEIDTAKFRLGIIDFESGTTEWTQDFSPTDTASTFQSGLEGLSGVGSGNISVSKTRLGADNLALKIEWIGTKKSSEQPSLQVQGDRGTPVLNTSVVGLIRGGAFATNEVQQVSISGSPSEGTFTLTFNGVRTEDLAYNADATTVESKLEDLASVGANNVNATGGPLPGTAIDVEFINGLSAQNVPEMIIDDTKLRSRIETTQHGAPEAQNEVQRLSIDGPRSDVHDGSFTLTSGGNTTAAIEWDADAAAVESALEALASVDDVVVTGGPFPAADMDVEFRGTQAATDVGEMTTASSLDLGTITIQTTRAGGADATVRETTRSAGPAHWDDPQNWTAGRIPESGDDVKLGPAASPLAFGIKQRATVTADAANDLLTMSQLADFRDDQKVRLRTTDTLPGGLSTGTDYWIVNLDRDARTFQLAASGGGAAINLTDSGTGTHTVAPELQSLVGHSSFGPDGEIGLPRFNNEGSGYVEYRPRYLEIGFADAANNGLLLVGRQGGVGSGRLKIDVGIYQPAVEVNDTGSGFPGESALELLFNNANCDLLVMGGEVAVASGPSESSTMGKPTLRGGTVVFGEVTSAGLELSAQARVVEANLTIGGQKVTFRS